MCTGKAQYGRHGKGMGNVGKENSTGEKGRGVYRKDIVELLVRCWGTNLRAPIQI